MTPAISVVLPIRNGARWLPAVLAALVREWATGFELIAIDDGSSDGECDNDGETEYDGAGACDCDGERDGGRGRERDREHEPGRENNTTANA